MKPPIRPDRQATSDRSRFAGDTHAVRNRKRITLTLTRVLARGPRQGPWSGGAVRLAVTHTSFMCFQTYSLYTAYFVIEIMIKLHDLKPSSSLVRSHNERHAL